MPPNNEGSRADVLAERLREQLQSSAPAEGTFFGTEAQVAVDHGVSRIVAREAVGRLKALGLLESRQRKGLVVRQPDPVDLLAQTLPSFLQTETDWAEMALLRYALEVGAIELAVRYATTEQMDRLDALARQFQALADSEQDDVEAENRLEQRFHAQILEMTGSRLTSGMQQVLARFFALSPHIASPNPTERRRTAWEHLQLAAAIRSRDLEQARMLIRAHFRSLLEQRPVPEA